MFLGRRMESLNVCRFSQRWVSRLKLATAMTRAGVRFRDRRARLRLVHERHLARDGSVAVVSEGYVTTELSNHAGEELEVLREDLASGWVWCRAKDG